MNYEHFIADEKIAPNTKRTYNSIHNLYFSSFEVGGIINYESIPEIIKFLSAEKIADKTKSAVFSLLTRLMKHSGLDAETIKKFKTKFFNSLTDSDEETEQVYITRFTNACIRKDKMTSFMVTYLTYWFDIREKDLRTIKIFDTKPTKDTDGFFLRAKSILFQADHDGKKFRRKFVIASERMLTKMRNMIGLTILIPSDTPITSFTYKNKTPEELTQIYLDCAADAKKEQRLATMETDLTEDQRE